MTPTVASLVEPERVPGVEFLVTSGEPMTSNVARIVGKATLPRYITHSVALGLLAMLIIYARLRSL